MLTSSDNIQSPFPYSPETLFRESYNYDHQNPNSNGEDDSPFISSFPSIFIDDHEFPLSQILPQHQNQPIVDQHENNNDDTNDPTNNKEKKDCDEVVKPQRRRSNGGSTVRKRTGKKDRHSKICTAQGVRDRRMRLSLPIARRFFDLQDMLGFDKASKTIEWLFSKSRKAINELISNRSCINNNNNLRQVKKDNSFCSTSEEKSESQLMSECEAASFDGMVEESNNEAARHVEEDEMRKPRRKVHNHHHAKECRERARARARERTREKMMMIRSNSTTKQWYESNPSHEDFDHHHQLQGHFSNFEDHPRSYSQKGVPHQADSQSIEHQFSSVSSFEKYLGGMDNLMQIGADEALSHGIDSNSSNSFMGILGNWDPSCPRINSSNGGTTIISSNMASYSGNSSTSASCCLPSSRNFPFLLQ